MRSKNAQLRGGFTLIEMMVSVSIFVIVAMVAVGALLAVNDTNRKSQRIRLLMDNLNFSLETMARELRLGSTYHCDISAPPVTSPKDCTAESIAFLDEDRHLVEYRVNTVARALERAESLDESASSLGPFEPVTFPVSATGRGVVIDHVTFAVKGSADSDSMQPYLVIVVRGSVGEIGDKLRTQFTIQTTVSERAIDS